MPKNLEPLYKIVLVHESWVQMSLNNEINSGKKWQKFHDLFPFRLEKKTVEKNYRNLFWLCGVLDTVEFLAHANISAKTKHQYLVKYITIHTRSPDGL